MPIKLTPAEITAFVAKGHKVTQGRSVGDALAGIAAKLAPAKAGVNRNAMQQRSDQDRYKSNTEREYASLLEECRLAGNIVRWEYEPFGIRIDDGSGKTCVFWPDFAVWYIRGEQPEFHEIKGKGKHALTPSARVKFLAARRLHPEMTFRCLQAPDWKEIL